MAENRILPFAETDTGTNLLSQAEYQLDRGRLVGNEPGLARSVLVNKVLKQTSLISAGVAQFLAEQAAAGDPDIADTLSVDEVAALLRKAMQGFAGSGGSGLPGGGKAGQALVMGENGQPEWQFVTGIPLGQLTFLPYDEPPPGFVPIGTDYETVIPLSAFPKAVMMACPAAFNEEADFFFRASDVDGDVRDADGDYLVLPAAARYFFRGFDASSGVSAYCYQGDAIRNIKGKIEVNCHVNTPGIGELGAFFPDRDDGSNAGAASGSGDECISFDASRVVPTADENRPMNISAFRVFIKLWDAAVTPAELDVQALVNEWAALRAQRPDVQYLDGMSAIIYPNGGSEKSPANVSVNQRFVMQSPFPGYYVDCEAQVLNQGNWGGTGWYTFYASSSRGARGVNAVQLNDDVIVQVGNNGLYYEGTTQGGAFTSLSAQSLPCRVIVTRLGRKTV